jgi:hypothetical protein
MLSNQWGDKPMADKDKSLRHLAEEMVSRWEWSDDDERNEILGIVAGMIEEHPELWAILAPKVIERQHRIRSRDYSKEGFYNVGT